MRIVYLKKAVQCLTVIAASLSVPAMQAQETELIPLPAPLDFLAVKDVTLETTHVFEYEKMLSWTGEGLHAGIQAFGLTIFNSKEIQRDAPIPENIFMICEISDMEGNRVATIKKDLESVFKRIKYTKNFTSRQSVSMGVSRGGEYKLVAEITPGLFSYEREFVLAADPGMRIEFPAEATVDSIPNPKIFLSSGYPYEPSDFSGEKQLHWQVTAVKAPTIVISEGTEAFELRSGTPTLAAIDSLDISPNILEPGEYQFIFTSDFAPANYSFIAKVNDVLAPEITLDKGSYTAGESKEATINVEMSYDYPFVGNGPDGEKPTVKVCAELLGEETSVTYSDDAWADSEMQCTAELKVPLGKVTEEVVKEYKGEIPLDLSIKFNGDTRHQETLTIPFETDTTSIPDIGTDTPNSLKVKYYNILGVEADETYHGFVISSDGCKIVR